MDKGYAVECSEREYITQWSEEQCAGFLSRRNASDTYEYDYVCVENPTITFLWRSDGSLHKHRRSLNAGYRMFFRPGDAGTAIRISYCRNPGGMKMTDVALDEFFRIKLDAIPC